MPEDEVDEPLTAEQWAAARLLVARLRSEAAMEPFDFEELGVNWIATDDLICAVSDTGDLMSLGDLFYAAIVMLWSLVLAQADETETSPMEVIANLGIGLAQHDPT